MGMLFCLFCAAASFIPVNNRRKRAIKELLGRFAPRLTEYDIAGLQGSLRIPRSWIDEAKVSSFHRLIEWSLKRVSGDICIVHGGCLRRV